MTVRILTLNKFAKRLGYKHARNAKFQRRLWHLINIGLVKVQQDGFLAHSMCHHRVVVFETKTIFPHVAFPQRRTPKRRKVEPPPKPSKLLSRLEISVLEALYKTHNLQKASTILGLKPSTVSVVIERLRQKIEQARELLKQAKKYRRALGTTYTF